MPFARPTLAELVTRTRADLRARLDNQGPLLRRAMPDILGSVWAGVVHMLHGHAEWISRQIFADTSDEDQLLRQAGLYGIEPTPAEFASGPVEASGVNGSIIPNLAILVYAVDGREYSVTNGPVVVAGGLAALIVEAVVAGGTANLAAGEILSFQTPIVGVNVDAVVDTGGIVGGEDEGTLEQTRTRLIERLREPPAGGRDADYIAWAKLVGGVTRVWVFPHENGLGTVVVRFVMDEALSIIPTVGDVAAVQASIDEFRPVTVDDALAVAPVSLPINFTISITPDNANTRAAVESELQDLLFRDGEPGDGVAAGTIRYSQITTAVGNAIGVEDFTVTVPAVDVVPALGEIAELGVITWV